MGIAEGQFRRCLLRTKEYMKHTQDGSSWRRRNSSSLITELERHTWRKVEVDCCSWWWQVVGPKLMTYLFISVKQEARLSAEGKDVRGLRARRKFGKDHLVEKHGPTTRQCQMKVQNYQQWKTSSAHLGDFLHQLSAARVLAQKKWQNKYASSRVGKFFYPHVSAAKKQ